MILGYFGVFRIGFGSILGHFGPIWVFVYFGSLWAQLGPFQDQFLSILGHFGPILGHFGPFWGCWVSAHPALCVCAPPFPIQDAAGGVAVADGAVAGGGLPPSPREGGVPAGFGDAPPRPQ
uniref:Uncharacterized protein n=1 Tax=Calidris pygmaea TaxID=425635 RepID=A0A8C3KD59_9CHAR